MPDEFQTWKKNFLSKKDKSNKGAIDRPILKLIEAINKKENYFTTSSCSGRTTIWIEPTTGIKKDVEFLYETHSKTNIKNIEKHLKQRPKQQLWFRFEPMILHVSCRTIEDANRLLDTIRQHFKHSGIMAARKKIMLEIRGSEFIETPIAEKGKLLVNGIYLKKLIREANKKLKQTHQKINVLTAALANAQSSLQVKRE